jgi:hypothetical protein
MAIVEERQADVKAMTYINNPRRNQSAGTDQEHFVDKLLLHDSFAMIS